MLAACWRKVLAWRCLHRYKIEHIYVRAKVFQTQTLCQCVHRSINTETGSSQHSWECYAEQLGGICTTHSEAPFTVYLHHQNYETAIIAIHTMSLGGTTSSQQHKTTAPLRHDQLQRGVQNQNISLSRFTQSFARQSSDQQNDCTSSN